MDINIYEVHLLFKCKKDAEESSDNSEVLATTADTAIAFAIQNLKTGFLEMDCKADNIEYVRLSECRLVYEDVRLIAPELTKIIKENY